MVTDIDWQNRRLCSDGNCIGVIGTDGRCKECGLPYGGDDLPQSSEDDHAPSEEAQVDDSQVLADELAPDAFVDDADGDEHDDDDDDWQNRRLCGDGNCIGVIGPDGRCKECGRPEADRPEDSPSDETA